MVEKLLKLGGGGTALSGGQVRLSAYIHMIEAGNIGIAWSQLYLSEKVGAQEKEIIEAALRECQGRVFGPSGAAAKLGIA